jgi:hypothetical protein
MLLVALVALGSATYAWFTVQKTVTADKMKVSVQKSAGIEITTDNGKSWSANESWSDTERKLYPASLDTTGDISAKKFYAPKYVDVDGGGTWEEHKTDVTGVESVGDATALKETVDAIPGGTKAEAANDNFAVYRFGVKAAKKSDGSTGTFSGVKAKVSLDTAASGSGADDYLRVALVSDDYKTVYATYGTAGKAFSSASAVTAQTVTALGQLSGAMANIDGTAKYYNVIVWYEGEDPDCVNNKSVSTCPLKIEVSYDNT